MSTDRVQEWADELRNSHARTEREMQAELMASKYWQLCNAAMATLSVLIDLEVQGVLSVEQFERAAHRIVVAMELNTF